MTLALDPEHQTPAISSTPALSEIDSAHYILRPARRGGYAGERRRSPATKGGQRGACAVVAWFRKQGYQVVRSPLETAPPDLLAWSSEELVLVLIRQNKRIPPSLHAIADLYRKDIRAFRGLPVPKGYHNSYQFWLSIPCRGWRVFEVLKGGIQEITRDL